MLPDMLQMVDVDAISVDHPVYVVPFTPPGLRGIVDLLVADDGFVGQHPAHLKRRRASGLKQILANASAATSPSPPKPTPLMIASSVDLRSPR